MMNVGSYINQQQANSPQGYSGNQNQPNNNNKFGYGVNPSQLMGGMDAMSGMGMGGGMAGMGGMGNGMQMNGMQSPVNPQMLQQQQSFSGMNGAAGMSAMGLDGMGSMNMGMGMNPNSMSSMGLGMNQNMSHGMNMTMGGNSSSLGNMGGMGMNAMNSAMLNNGANFNNPSGGQSHSSNNMNPGMNMGMNHANPSASSMNMNPSPHPIPSSNSNANPTANLSQAALNMNFMTMLQNMGMSKQQFAQLSPQEKQMIQMKVVAATQQQQQQQQLQLQLQRMQQQQGQSQNQGQGGQGFPGMGMGDIQQPRPNDPRSGSVGPGQFYDRPSSSASASSHHNHPGQQQQQQQQQPQNRMPPPPRPSTAQGVIGQQMSRPGTSHSHHSPSSSVVGLSSMNPMQQQPQQHQQPRPPSRSTSATPGANGSFMHSQNPGMMQGSPPPGSPVRKRKATLDSPRMGGDGVLSGGMGMGPPGLPRQSSVGTLDGLGAMPPGTPQIGGMGNGMPMTPRARSPSTNSMTGMHQQQQQAQRTNMNPQMAAQMDVSGMGMGNLGMTMNIPGGLGIAPMDPSASQRQGSMPPQAPGFHGAGAAGSQTPRQPSLPPPGTPQKTHTDGSIGRGSLPPNVGPQPISTSSSSTGVAVPPSQPSQAQTQVPPLPVPVPPQSQPQPAPQPAIIPQLPPLPANVSLNPAVTRVTVVPLIDSMKSIPPLSEKEIEDTKGWIEVDKEYDGVFRKMKDRVEEERKDMFGVGSLAWWEKGSLMSNAGVGTRFGPGRRGREVFDVRYPRTRKDRDRRKGGVKREGMRVPRCLRPEEADRPEELVPIRLEFEVEQHHKMRDTFVWNLNDPVVTPESFAQSVVDDYGLNASYHSTIVKAIQEQLSDYKAHSSNYDGDEKPVAEKERESGEVFKGKMEDEDVKWWESWRKSVTSEERRLRKKSSVGGKNRKRRKIGGQQQQDEVLAPSDVGNDEDIKPIEGIQPELMNVDEASVHEDMRILVKLDIIVGSVKLDDQFEWDLDNQDASPEEFADVYAKELGLGGEFKTAIAHSIREQIQTYQKSLFLIGHPSDGGFVQDDDLRMSFLPSLTSGARPISEVQSFTPLLNYLSDGEIEKNEKERDKDMTKRRKRATRGRRGVALPDREPIRTYRTPAIGFPELDPATLAAAIAASAPTSRRAAAAAASLTIANMVASENGTAFIPQTIQAAPQPVPTAVKEKKPKGLFKPPTLPDEVLHKRSQVTAPTPSTAADVSKLPAPLENDPPMEPIEPPVSTATAAMPDSRFSKVITAKRAKELEREAKEKEFADGQHPNYIDGVWHCSNCGCPEGIAIGRRKGPLGDKSQCGTCGKFWHRHRRPRPVEYNTSLEFHLGVKKEAEGSKTGGKRKTGAAALRAQSSTLPNTPMELPSEPQTPQRNDKIDLDPSTQSSPAPAIDDLERAASPVSTASSASEPPLSQRVKMNGNHSNPPPSALSSSKPPPSESNPSPAKQHPVPVVEVPPPPSASKPWPPLWLTNAMQTMQGKYTNDKFEVILRKVTASTTPEWRIKCLDCPGKLYTPGPGETLSNYEVHLKNRQHRQRVNERVNGSAAS